jgi:hypothetical protein
MSHKIDRTGETNVSMQGCKMTIVTYRNNNDIDVLFDDYNCIKEHMTYHFFKKGQIKNPMFPSVCGVGYIGVGNYTPKENGKKTEQYECWEAMFRRCYIDKQPWYEGCSVGGNFVNLQYLGEWYDKNKWNDDIRMTVDKDILVKHNHIYCEDRCLLVDKTINNLFIRKRINKNNLPIGVTRKRKKYSVHVNDTYRHLLNTNETAVRHIGVFDNVDDAFNAYKREKESIIKNVANYYKEKFPKFPSNLYNAMMNYEVLEDD